MLGVFTNGLDRRSRSLWMDVEVAPNVGRLDRDKICDTVVVGTGIAGISTAYELAAKGQKVILVDRGPIAGGITARTTAHLAPLCDDLTSEMIKLRGEAISRAFYESQAAAIDRIEEIQKKEAIACDFRRLDGYLFQALDTDAKIIDDELDAVRKVGAPVHRIVGVSLAGCEAAFIGRNPGNQNIYVHTGDSGQGITHGVVGSLGNSALILGEYARWVDVYDPSR